jgi:signal transduction histidine kinase
LENHGATIDVVSEEGKGSTFTIRFPIAQEPKDSEMGR